ncbi:protein CHROMATIN REMODELING [Trifolium repens]|nr:protein CHROMATIN REMODELING [Trifolium repens]
MLGGYMNLLEKIRCELDGNLAVELKFFEEKELLKPDDRKALWKTGLPPQFLNDTVHSRKMIVNPERLEVELCADGRGTCFEGQK